jgi:branched-chain amino acid transport system permease protein
MTQPTVAAAGVAPVAGGVLTAVEKLGVPVRIVLQMADSFAFVTLAAIGLAVIFGMMGVINLAHGEFIMMGAYATTLGTTQLGLPYVVAICFGVVVTALFGALVERTIISGVLPNSLWGALLSVLPETAATKLPDRLIEPLYGRLLDSMVATFGLGLILTQGTRIVFGNTIDSVDTPLGAVPGYTYSAYRVVLAFVAVGVLLTAYVVFTRTGFGTRARATIQDADTARAMGVDTGRMYTATFAVGSGLAGLTGALYAPTESMAPGMGAAYLVEAFVAVVTGGSSVLAGTLLSGTVLGSIRGIVASELGVFLAKMALLVTAILVIRLLQDGLSGLAETVWDKIAEGRGAE